MSEKRVFLYSLLILILTAYVDYRTGDELAISIFYLIPVAFIAWHLSKKIAIPFALICATLEIVIQYVDDFSRISSFVFYWNILINCCTYALVAFLVSKLTEAYKKEKQMARIDALTGIPNWQSFSEVLERELERAKRYGQNLSLAYIDCDNFKKVNDQMGHQTGNQLLSIVASTIDKNIRKTDFVARIGGDEFSILLTGASAKDAEKIIKKIKELLVIEMKDNYFAVTFSIGLATFEKPPSSYEEMIKLADLLMYDVKNSSKNNIKHEIFRSESNISYL